jgi:CubicO group peptidase (beta-lactamase class C family)
MVLQGLGAACAAAALSGWSSASAQASPAAHDRLASFAAQVQAEFTRMRLVGAAVAVVSRDRVLHRQPLGVRDLRTRVSVTASTRFLVASTTKSMASVLVATLSTRAGCGGISGSSIPGLVPGANGRADARLEGS